MLYLGKVQIKQVVLWKKKQGGEKTLVIRSSQLSMFAWKQG